MRSPAFALFAAALVVLVVAGPSAAVGTDPGLPQQWGLKQIGAPSAWSTSVGAGVPIAIVDTGVDVGHEDLRDQVAAAVTCVGTGGDPAKCVADGRDINGHGSHVAGIVAAAGNDVGVSGVAPGARIIVVRVFSKTTNPVTGQEQFGANTDDINAGIRWAIRNVAAKGVINLSIGDELPVALGSAGFADGVEEAWSAGWVTALAAGNEGNLLGLNGEEYGELNAVVVGATGPSGSMASSSPIGSAKWGLVAPGGDAPDCRDEAVRKDCVLSTYAGGQYAFLEGTSMATPHVAGGLALLMAAGQSNAAAVQRLLATLDSSKTCGSGCKGRLDVAKAVSGLAPAGGGGGGGAATTAAPTAPAGPSGPPPSTATTRRAAGSPVASTAPAGVETTSTVAAPGPSIEETTTSTVPADVEPLSIDEAAGAEDDDGDRTVPIGLGALAVVAMVGVAVPATIAGRRARGGGGR